MSTLYASEAASARTDVGNAGAVVTFSFANPGTYDETADAFTGPSTPTVSGAAIEQPGSIIKYQALGLIGVEAHTLFFAPDTIGQLPPLDATVTWGGVLCSVKSIEPLAPDGTALAATIIVVTAAGAK